MPSPAVADLDRGALHYANTVKFATLPNPTVDTVHEAVDELIKDPGEFKTFILDGVTNYHEALQEKHLKRLRVKKNNPAYAFQISDYKPIKSDFKAFVNKLNALDMNVVVTARLKTIYSQDPGEFMKAIDTTYEGPKETEYLFDTVIELKMGPNDTRIAVVKKDRTNTLPKEFEFTFQKLAEYFGMEDLNRAPLAVRSQQALNSVNKRSVTITLGGKDIKTAGITADTLTKILEVVKTQGIKESELRDKLNEDYSVTDIRDLREDEGKVFLNDILTSGIAIEKGMAQ